MKGNSEKIVKCWVIKLILKGSEKSNGKKRSRRREGEKRKWKERKSRLEKERRQFYNVNGSNIFFGVSFKDCYCIIYICLYIIYILFEWTVHVNCNCCVSFTFDEYLKYVGRLGGKNLLFSFFLSLFFSLSPFLSLSLEIQEYYIQ